MKKSKILLIIFLVICFCNVAHAITPDEYYNYSQTLLKYVKVEMPYPIIDKTENPVFYRIMNEGYSIMRMIMFFLAALFAPLILWYGGMKYAFSFNSRSSLLSAFFSILTAVMLILYGHIIIIAPLNLITYFMGDVFRVQSNKVIERVSFTSNISVKISKLQQALNDGTISSEEAKELAQQYQQELQNYADDDPAAQDSGFFQSITNKLNNIGTELTNAVTSFFVIGLLNFTEMCANGVYYIMSWIKNIVIVMIYIFLPFSCFLYMFPHFKKSLRGTITSYLVFSLWSMGFYLIKMLINVSYKELGGFLTTNSAVMGMSDIAGMIILNVVMIVMVVAMPFFIQSIITGGIGTMLFGVAATTGAMVATGGVGALGKAGGISATVGKNLVTSSGKAAGGAVKNFAQKTAGAVANTSTGQALINSPVGAVAGKTIGAVAKTITSKASGIRNAASKIANSPFTQKVIGSAVMGTKYDHNKVMAGKQKYLQALQSAPSLSGNPNTAAIDNNTKINDNVSQTSKIMKATEYTNISDLKNKLNANNTSNISNTSDISNTSNVNQKINTSTSVSNQGSVNAPDSNTSASSLPNNIDPNDEDIKAYQDFLKEKENLLKNQTNGRMKQLHEGMQYHSKNLTRQFLSYIVYRSATGSGGTAEF